MPIATTETKSIPDAIAAIERRLTEVKGLIALLPGLADTGYREGDGVDEYKRLADGLLHDADGFIADIESGLSALRKAEHEMPLDGELSHSEHVAQERSMARWRSAA